MLTSHLRYLGPRLLVLLLVGSSALCPLSAAADTVMITGANSGIGLEFAKQYAEKGWTVIATHRRAMPPKSLTDLAARYPKVRIESLDVTDLDQARALAAKLAGVPVDVLINNAGVYNDRAKCAGDDEGCPGDWSVEGFGNLKYSLLDTMMAVNIKGPLIVSETFYKNVLASTQKKIIAVSSSNGTLTGEAVPRPGAMFYRMSKAALNREMQIVAASTKKDGVTVVMFNPGPTLTEHQAYLEGKYQGMLKTSFTVQNMIQTIGKLTLADSGRFLRYDGMTEPW
ncbi:MAG TPA: SDR family NAD(P)-dependent oxidoreductase [Steroidobacteraceae bacterium]|jgi:NAD(P)-dependent dehydrogenase (short-subunit alcohol dehydrogenase family)|nr:SDR family NAD(P)-dependent oxidoreductase [Steroidobacteraceae bacterium]